MLVYQLSYAYRLLDKYTAVGIYSQCGSQNTSKLNNNARNFDDDYKTAVASGQYGKNYYSFDVCNNTEAVVEILIDILLNRTYFMKPNKNESVWRHQNLLQVISFGSDKMLKLVREVTSVINDTLVLCIPNECDEELYLPTIDDHADDFIEVLNSFHWYDVMLISYIGEDEVGLYWDQYFNKTYSKMQPAKKFCLQHLENVPKLREVNLLESTFG